MNDLVSVSNLTSYGAVLEKVSGIQNADGRWVFRGQSDVSWTLCPSAYRGIEQISPPPVLDDTDWIGEIERDVYREFEKASPRFWPDGVASDRWTKLFVAQHYGIPTRLLDWTSTLQVAVHYAVAGSRETDASLWMLNAAAVPAPTCLGKFPRQGYGFALPVVEEHCPIDRVHFFDPYSKNVILGNEVAEGNEPAGIFSTSQLVAGDNRGWLLVVEPPHLFPRIANQRGLFSVYVSDSENDIVWDHENHLRQIEKQERSTLLCKLTIPAKAKSEVLRGLLTSGFDYL